MFVLSSSVFAEKVILKSGAIYEGTIIDHNDKYITLQTSGTPVYLPVEQIERIVEEIPTSEVAQQSDSEAQLAPANLQDQYQQLMKETADAFDKGDYSLAEEKSKAAIEINLDGNEAYYMIAIAQYSQAKYEEAVKNYNKAVDLGFVPSPEVEMAMQPYQYKEFSINIPFGKSFQFKGSTNCSKQLITDMLPAMEASVKNAGKSIMIRPRFVQWGEEGKYWEEEWIVEAKDGDKIFSLILTPTPDGGADYQIIPRKL